MSNWVIRHWKRAKVVKYVRGKESGARRPKRNGRGRVVIRSLREVKAGCKIK